MLFLVNMSDILRGWTLFSIVYKPEYIGKQCTVIAYSALLKY
jgi:hypothetical protein